MSNLRYRNHGGGWGVWFIVAIVILIPFSLWMHFAAPCGAYKFSGTKDLPTRCLNHYTGGK